MADALAETPLPLPLQHLQLRLRALNRDILKAVETRREATRRQAQVADMGAEGPESMAGVATLMQALNPQARVCINDARVDFLISEVEALCRGEGHQPDDEGRLRAEAKSQGMVLPLERLEFELPLSPTQMDAVLLCVAPEFDNAYENLYAFILDDVSRRYPCPELFCGLADSIRDRFDRRRELGRFGRLRVLGVVVPNGTALTELRQEFRLAPGLFEFLLDGRGDPADLFRDPDEVRLPATFQNPPHVNPDQLTRLGKALKERTVEVVGVWAASRQAGPEDVALSLAKCSDRPLRRWKVPEPRNFDVQQEKSLQDAIQFASVLDSTLWIKTDAITDPSAPESTRLGDALAEQLASSQVRAILTGSRPWQPPGLLAARSFHAIQLSPPDPSQRRVLWQQAAPGAIPAVLDDLAARFPVNGTEARAAAGLASTARKLNPTPPNGSSAGGSKPATVDPLLAASTALDQINVSRFTTLVEPARGPADLILPEPLKTQVLEIADFHRAWPGVRGAWGFGRMMTGPGGIKALFAGDSGTGKTLAAEVIAKLLGRPLLKFDLSQIVSKWVGETEKHLDEVFLEAQDRDSVLCLDEADSLLGKRGEIRHGTDRYANLEVSYLLQRLEEHPGLVVMASNHKENIDPAFMRRFQTILLFPRPGPDERQSIWRIAFPENSAYRRAENVKFEELARLDMTGAAIVESARTAALLSAKSARPGEQATVELRHVADAIRRQYQREARVLTARELKLLGEEP